MESDRFVMRFDGDNGIEPASHRAVISPVETIPLYRPETVGQALPVKIDGMAIIFLVTHSLLLVTRERYNKKDRRDKNIHPDRIQIRHPPARYILPREKAGSDDQLFNRHKKLAVEMCDVLKKVPDEVPNGFLRLQVLLAAPRTIPLLYGKTAVQAGLVMSEMMSAHSLS